MICQEKTLFKEKITLLLREEKMKRERKGVKWNRKRMEKKNEYNFLPCLDGLKTRRK
jgi:hypothetical protein